ncbi:hypothetical protein TCELL_0241 [Thermogladius calderae 1633]|uniref:Uncharacterized protein n=1 Tax=Thermogladius calderae (strain DSM 22663 / VKM B-2946 / 1633) TaxID=1184251 RepID=I3TD28_THEC1|nr:hypothetical protein [Thermogladius calderae]AFK50666.1 hypothetical protein TCELL_0241 [Thermogladius calderae 1633]
MGATLLVKLYMDAVSEVALPKLARALREKGFRVEVLPPVSLIALLSAEIGAVHDVIYKVKSAGSTEYVRSVCLEYWARASKCPCNKPLVKVGDWVACSDTIEGTQLYIRCSPKGVLVRVALRGSLRDLVSPPSSIFTVCTEREGFDKLITSIGKSLEVLSSYVRSLA